MNKNYYYIYIVTNQSRTVFYTGVTNNLERRIYEHKHKIVSGFTSKYNMSILVYYELFDSIEDAIAREKQIKGLLRRKKITLIKNKNPQLIDLYLNCHPE